MRVCPHCGRTLNQAEKVCPVCANAPSKKKKPYWIFVIAALLIVIVLMAVALHLTLEKLHNKTQDEVSIESSEEASDVVPEEPEEPEDIPEADDSETAFSETDDSEQDDPIPEQDDPEQDDPTPVQDDSEWIFPDSSERLLTDADIAGKTKQELRIAVNEIYAKHGRRFNSADLQAYFDGCSWYNGTIAASMFTDDMLNATELANAKFLLNAIKK